jgi:osmotically inducible protein OsmC
MTEKTASVHGQGPGRKGPGQIGTETGALGRCPYGFAGRFDDDRRGTNPEEILGAGHAACFTMTFSFACNKAKEGFVTQSVDTQAHVRRSPQGEGFEIDRIMLKLSAAVPGLPEARLQEIALAAKRECPPSKAWVAGSEISMQATLEEAAR